MIIVLAVSLNVVVVVAYLNVVARRLGPSKILQEEPGRLDIVVMMMVVLRRLDVVVVPVFGQCDVVMVRPSVVVVCNLLSLTEKEEAGLVILWRFHVVVMVVPVRYRDYFSMLCRHIVSKRNRQRPARKYCRGSDNN